MYLSVLLGGHMNTGIKLAIIFISYFFLTSVGYSAELFEYLSHDFSSSSIVTHDGKYQINNCGTHNVSLKTSIKACASIISVKDLKTNKTIAIDLNSMLLDYETEFNEAGHATAARYFTLGFSNDSFVVIPLYPTTEDRSSFIKNSDGNFVTQVPYTHPVAIYFDFLKMFTYGLDRQLSYDFKDGLNWSSTPALSCTQIIILKNKRVAAFCQTDAVFIHVEQDAPVGSTLDFVLGTALVRAVVFQLFPENREENRISFSNVFGSSFGLNVITNFRVLANGNLENEYEDLGGGMTTGASGILDVELNYFKFADNP